MYTIEQLVESYNRHREYVSRYGMSDEGWEGIAVELGCRSIATPKSAMYRNRKRGLISINADGIAVVLNTKNGILCRTKKSVDISNVKDTFLHKDDEICCRVNDTHPLSVDDVIDRFKVNVSQNIDINDYEVSYFKVESWDVSAKIDGDFRKSRNYLTDVRFKKKCFKGLLLEEDKRQVIELCKSYAPKLPPAKQSKLKSPVMLELGVYDAHYGKLSIIDRTGEMGSLEGASVMVRNAITDLVDRVNGYNIEKIVFPIGNDFMHINNAKGETANGTQMEYTNYLYQIRRKCKEDLVWIIEKLRRIAPVDVIQIPGNHDEDAMLSVAEIIDAYFHNTKDVSVDISPKERKAIRYGKMFIGFCHGDSKSCKIDRLPLVFAKEFKQDWLKSEYHDIHIGHLHFKKDMTFIIGDEFTGVRVIWLPSLASADAWHYKKGFIGSRKAAEAFIWDKDEGLIGNFSVNVRMK